jgi:hypothetical protein
MLTSSKWSLPFRFTDKNLVCVSLSPMRTALHNILLPRKICNVRKKFIHAWTRTAAVPRSCAAWTPLLKSHHIHVKCIDSISCQRGGMFAFFFTCYQFIHECLGVGGCLFTAQNLRTLNHRFCFPCCLTNKNLVWAVETETLVGTENIITADSRPTFITLYWTLTVRIKLWPCVRLCYGCETWSLHNLYPSQNIIRMIKSRMR